MVSISAILRHLDQETSNGLQGLPGDGYLISRYPRFKRVRKLALEHGLEFICSGPVFQEYVRSPLTSLELITKNKTIPYRYYSTESDLQKLIQGQSRSTPATFHETAHLLIRQANEYTKILKARNEDTLIPFILIEESIVNTAEWLMAIDIHDEPGRLCWSLQSPVTTSLETRQSVQYIRKKYGSSFLFRFALESYLCANFNRDTQAQYDFNRVSNDLNAARCDEKILSELFFHAFHLDPKFRQETNSSYISNRIELKHNSHSIWKCYSTSLTHSSSPFKQLIDHAEVIFA